MKNKALPPPSNVVQLYSQTAMLIARDRTYNAVVVHESTQDLLRTMRVLREESQALLKEKQALLKENQALLKENQRLRKK